MILISISKKKSKIGHQLRLKRVSTFQILIKVCIALTSFGISNVDSHLCEQILY